MTTEEILTHFNLDLSEENIIFLQNCLEREYNEGFDDGDNEGYSRGRDDFEADDRYDEGYQDGLDANKEENE